MTHTRSPCMVAVCFTLSVFGFNRIQSDYKLHLVPRYTIVSACRAVAFNGQEALNMPPAAPHSGCPAQKQHIAYPDAAKWWVEQHCTIISFEKINGFIAGAMCIQTHSWPSVRPEINKTTLSYTVSHAPHRLLMPCNLPSHMLV